MSPCLHEGDVLHYEPLKSFSVGDIILFYDGESKEVVAHRCVKKDLKENIWVKGDRNLSFDNFLSSHYIGRVNKIQRKEEIIPLQQRSLRMQWVAFFSFYSSQRSLKIVRYLCQLLIRLIYL